MRVVSKSSSKVVSVSSYTLSPAVSLPLVHPGLVSHAIISASKFSADGDDESCTPLMYAAVSHDLEQVRQILVETPDLAARDRHGKTALHHATMCGHADVAHLLISSGAPVEAADQYGTTPLMTAALFGFFEVAQLLLASGGDRRSTDQHGRTAYQMARFAGDAELVQLLRV